MAARRRVLRTLGFFAALIWVGGLAGCHDEDSGPETVCSQVRGVWDVTTAPFEGYPNGLFQRWTISMDGDCSVTITPEDRAYGGPFIGDSPGTGDATGDSLLATWSYRVSTYC